MSERTASPVRGPRLNPFAFPSETTLRFVLLVIFVICGSALLYGEFHGQTDPAVHQCLLQAWSGISELTKSSPADIGRDATNFGVKELPLLARCAALMRPEILWKIGGIGLVILVAAAFYYLYPTWTLWRGRLKPLDPSELPEIVHELQRLAETARLPDPPALVWNPLAVGLPVVFGRHGRYYVALSGSFIAQFYQDRDSFRAIMLHELAHIHNGDIPKTYLTLSLWLAFLATTLVPSLLLSSWHLATLRWWAAASLLLNSMLWTAVVILSGLAVLRAREYYADIRASVWDRASQVDRALAALAAPAGKGWRRYLWFHPDPTQRRQIVEDPSRLLRLDFADAFGIGIAAWSVVGVITGLLLPFSPTDASAAFVFFMSLRPVVSAVVFVLAIGAIGIGVWRSAFASLLKGNQPSKGAGWLGAAFVAGALPGLIVRLADGAFQSFAEQPVPFWIYLTTLELNVGTYIGLLVGCLLIFRWISEAASAWFEVVLQRRSPRPVLLSTVAMALILVVGVLALATFVMEFSFAITPWRQAGAGGIYLYMVIAAIPIVIASLVAWAFPLTALWWRKQVMPARVAHWVFLDGASPQIPSQEPVRPGGALLTGIVMALLFWLSWELLHFRGVLPTGIGDGINSVFGWLFAGAARVFGDRSFLLPASAACFQALAAAIVAGRTRRLSAVCGLFAASVAGFIIAVGQYIFVGIGSDHASELVFTSLRIVGLGVAVALPTLIVTTWIANVARRVSANAPGSPKSGDPAARLSASPTRQGRSTVWSVVSKASVATLFVVVSIGMTARVRTVVLSMEEVNAYRASAERGDSDAQNKLGSMYARGQSVSRDHAQAVFWWRNAAEQGHADAQFNLAQMFFEGQGVAQDDIMAAQWVRKAAEQGHAGAEHGFGILYARGRGVPQDDSLAVQWFRKAAAQGHAGAQHALGIFLSSGRGTPRDDAAAVQWFHKAAEQGHADAQFNLAGMFFEGRGVAQDDIMAARWVRKAAEQGHAGAEYGLGILYARGRGVSQDDSLAVQWFRKAAAQGHADAQRDLGIFLSSGRGTPRDDAAAMEWFRKAAEQGHADAQFRVGEIYETGEVVAKDDEQAVLWLRKASDKGHPEAKNHLQALCDRGLRVACSP